MKKTIKISLIILLSILTIILSGFIYYLSTTKNVKLDENLLVNLDKTVSYYDQNDNLLFTQASENKVTEIDKIPLHVQNAFIAVEDKRFYKHNGVDFKGLSRAMLSNIKTLSFKEGGSTITQQLIKNTHFTNQKTIKRKLSEIKLARKLEKKYSKKQILEKYLNTIYFGENCYGIAEASEKYFNKKPSDLTINEGALLAGIIKAPSSYSPKNNKERALNRKNLVLKLMHEQGYLDDNSLNQNLNSDINISENSCIENHYRYEYLAKKEFNEIIKKFPYWNGNLKIVLSVDKNLQKNIEESVNSFQTNTDKTLIILNKNGEIKGYFSTCGNINRQMGSTFKPLISYGPAIEKNLVYSCTPILDEKTNFNGYSPSNYKNVYYGYVSVKDSLAKSLNVCSVKLLNYAGVEDSRNFVNKTDINLTENDNSLCLALGATEKGATLIEICSAYDLFLNQGVFYPAHIIKKITNEKGTLIYNKNNSNHQIFSEETTHILNDMMENVVKEGTAKKLNFTNIPLCAKTGTVGNEYGNTDAYCISYNSEFIIGSWLGNSNGTLMSNSITGGSIPTIISSILWKKIYNEKSAPPSYIKSQNVIEEYVDRIEYEKNNSVVLANEFTPDRYKFKTIFKKDNLPKIISNAFKNPKIENAEISLNTNQIEIKLCLTEYYNAYIYKNSSKGKQLIVDTALLNNKNLIIDKLILPNEVYEYSIIPYYKYKEQIILGEELYLNKIKTPAVNVNDWWKNDL